MEIKKTQMGKESHQNYLPELTEITFPSSGDSLQYAQNVYNLFEFKMELDTSSKLVLGVRGTGVYLVKHFAASLISQWLL